MANWYRKFILLFKSEKRLGANQIIDHYAWQNIEAMKSRMIDSDTCSIIDTIIQAHPRLLDDSQVDEPIDPLIDYEPRRIRNLYTHLTTLQHEFIGQSELNFYHAILIVLLRRRFQPEKTFQTFTHLWQTQTDYLMDNLSLRWIASACDTFIDFDPKPIRKAILLNIITLINTIKVYETQQYLCHSSASLDEEKSAILYAHHKPLYGGLTYFRLGKDDTLKHMRERYQHFYAEDPFSTTLLLKVFARLHDQPSAFTTLKQLHKDEKSAWW